MEYKIENGLEHIEEIRELFEEYTQMLVDGDPAFRQYLDIQHFDEEMLNLAKKYKSPFGRLFILFVDHKPAGCVGFKKLNEKSCEMKRLYLRPAYRGSHLSQILLDLILEEAKNEKYETMYIDTLPFLKSAIRLYEKYGFVLTDRYNDSPMDSSIFMRKKLSSN